ncbi:hypothetical protein GR210_09445 [Rhizobium leguminosarum]|uniref:hypothetical protein n=1 Tax=Rhizobium leguminosarum TaxID=384 RepID=UPI0013DCF714|nr:hypothetical protein [Rhizobium leguminosarum]MBY5312734.1 hypothetical protein [Rhizobium leguminosarum]NEH49019.1 hypothetical protein [Rhizobium leguminosarum]
MERKAVYGYRLASSRTIAAPFIAIIAIIAVGLRKRCFIVADGNARENFFLPVRS